MPIVCMRWRGEHVEQQVARCSVYTFGRDLSCCSIPVPTGWHPCSRLQATLRWTNHEWILEDGFQGRSSSNGTYLLDGARVKGKTSLGPLAEVSFLVGAPLSSPISITIKELDKTSAELDSYGTTPLQSISSDVPAMAVSGAITIGRNPNCNLHLEDPTISRLHAVVNPEPGGTAVVEDRSSNGIFINGHKAPRLSRIQTGCLIRVGRTRLHWDGCALSVVGDSERYGIEIRDLDLANRIRNVSLSIHGGQLVALVGGSGAGKSSLLTTIAGHNPGYTGLIRINGEDLCDAISSIRPLMGFVPQDDVIHRDLSVLEVLSFTAKLRIPDRDARSAAVERVIDLLEIGHRRNALVRDLSGGQRKRVSIGMELISDPRLLFLDEPTSGLDPGLDRRMMRLLRELADRGHTVLLVTHATANVHLCDQIVFMGRGGRLCYSGPPRDCLRHFGVNEDFAEVYEKLELSDEELETQATQFRHGSKLPLLQPVLDGQYNQTRSLSSSQIRILYRLGSQLSTLIRRELLLVFRDHVSLTLNLLTAPVAVGLLAIAIQNRGVFTVSDGGPELDLLPMAMKVVFVIACACIWTGISSHISSVARERSLFERERAFNLMPASFLSAKAIMIILLAVPQAAIISLTALALFNLPGELAIGHPFFGFILACFMTIISSGAMALLVSALVKDQRQATSSSPLLLMPQLIFSGVLFELGALSTLFPLVASRWSVKLLGAYSSLEDLHLDPDLPGLTVMDINPFQSTMDNVRISVLVLLLQYIIGAMLAFVALSRSSRLCR